MAIDTLDLRSRVTLDIAPFQLYPNTPIEGKRVDFDRLLRQQDQLSAAGRAVGIHYRWDLITRIPNTLDIHQRLMQLSHPWSRWQAKEVIFQAYFSEGIDLTLTENIDTLLAPFEDEGQRHYSSSEASYMIQAARDRGITAVPSFILDGEHHITGALEYQQWAQFLTRRFQLN